MTVPAGIALSLDHLPGTARELVDLIGLPATLRLVDAYGGRTIQIAKGKRSRGAAQLQALAECVGKVAARAIAERYPGDFLSIPNCKRAVAALRDARLQARFDELTAVHSARAAVALLTAEFGLVESSIWRALKRPSASLRASDGAAADTVQPGLF